MNNPRPAAFTVEPLDPEWTVYIRCPFDGCAVRTFSCCADHAREGMAEHIRDRHAEQNPTR